MTPDTLLTLDTLMTPEYLLTQDTFMTPDFLMLLNTLTAGETGIESAGHTHSAGHSNSTGHSNDTTHCQRWRDWTTVSLLDTLPVIATLITLYIQATRESGIQSAWHSPSTRYSARKTLSVEWMLSGHQTLSQMDFVQLDILLALDTFKTPEHYTTWETGLQSSGHFCVLDTIIYWTLLCTGHYNILDTLMTLDALFIKTLDCSPLDILPVLDTLMTLHTQTNGETGIQSAWHSVYWTLSWP